MFHSSAKNFVGATQGGIKLGDTKNKLIKTYGMPDVVNSTRQGAMLLYQNKEMLVLLNESGNISKSVIVRELY